MSKRLLFCFLFLVLIVNSAYSKNIIRVKQKDWPEYFPNIERHPSVYEPEFAEVDMSYETPHTKWAKPYYRGKVRALVIAPRVCHRDTIELAQRLDIRFDAFCAYNSKRLGGERFEGGRNKSIGYGTLGRYSTPVGYEQGKQVNRLNKLLHKQYDVIIIGQMFWEAFPEDMQNKILNRVKKGTGLVISFADRNQTDFIPAVLKDIPFIGQTQRDLIGKGIPFTALSSWKHFKSNQEAINKIVSLRKLGKGKVAILSVGGKSRNIFFVPSPPNKPEIKLWEIDYYFSLASKAVLWVAGKSPDSDLGCVIKHGFVEIKTSGIKIPVDFSFRVRNVFGETVHQEEKRKKTFKLPELPAGEYIADVIAKAKGKSLNWHSTSFKIKREPTIKSVDVSPKTLEQDTKLILTATLSNKAKEDMSLRVQLIDVFGRLIADISENILPDRDTAKTEIVLSHPLSNLIKAKVVLYNNKQKLSRFETFIPVKVFYPRDDFGFVCWGIFPNEYLWHYARRELYKLGVDSSYGGYRTSWMQSWAAATAGFHIIPYMTRYAIGKTTKGPCHERMSCLSNQKYIEAQQERLRKIAQATSPFAPVAYSLGDENDLSINDHEVCFSKSCKDGFREYIKRIYKNIEALNREWDTAYNSWDEIEPIPLEEARKLNQPARWVDFRMHMENVFLNIHKTGKETIKGIDPDALVGFDGGFDITSFTGYDWWKLSRVLDLWGIYPDHLQAEILRSFHREEARTGRWYGGYNHLTRFVEYAHWEPWYVLFHEMNSIWWFNTITSFTSNVQAEDAMNPASFKPFPILKASSEEALEIKSGIGKLLLGCRRDSGGIAILYSQPSLHAATYYSKYGNPNDSQYDFIRILEDLNYQYRFISYEQLKQGILERENYRLLILPCSIALSGQEKEQICSFVEHGGKVIADIVPGIYDEHGKPIEDSKWERFIGERAVVIGRDISRYKSGNTDASAMRALFAKRLKELSIKPEFYVTTSTGEVYEGELAIFTDGNMKYVGLLRHHSPKIKRQKAQIILPAIGYVYDVRAGRFSGYSDKIKTNLKPGMAGLWAILPEKVSGLKLQMKSEASLGEELLYSITMKTSDRHVIRIEVFDPEGNMQRHYCRNINLDMGKAEGIIPLALNDKTGNWKIEVRDVATGCSDTKMFRVSFVSTTHADEQQNVSVCHRKDGELIFDGKLNDAIWKDKLITETFFKSKKLGHAKYQTKVYSMWDNEYLYFGAKMYDEDIVGNLTQRDDPIYNEDAFEVFVRPNTAKRFIYEFEFSPLGTIWDGLDKRGLPNTSGYRVVTRKAWNAKGLLCAFHVDGTINDWSDKDKYWSIEIKIPLKNFTFRNISPFPQKGDRWMIAFARCESSIYLDRVEYSASIPISKYGVWENYSEWWEMIFE